MTKILRQFFRYITFASPLLLLFTAASASAAPMPPRWVINHQTRQCAQIVPGDECGDVILPPGWSYLDEAGGEKCPADYATVEVHFEWAHFKAPHCCTEGHSGVAGDCQDVVIQLADQKCAFVEDIQNCPRLPDGWQALGKECPKGFKWVETLACLESQPSPAVCYTDTPPLAPTFTLLPQTSPPLSPTSENGQPPRDASNPLLPCASFGLALLALIAARFRLT